MKLNLRLYRPMVVLTLLYAAPAGAGDLTLPLPAGVAATRIAVRYQCEGLGPFQVDYLSAGAVSLALMTLDGQAQAFAQVLSGSGARYASGPYVWWIKGIEGTLQDLRGGEGAQVLKCKAAS